MIRILDAGPQTTVQDGGRLGQLRYGIPPSGPVDRFAFVLANRLVGNPDGAAAPAARRTARAPRLRRRAHAPRGARAADRPLHQGGPRRAPRLVVRSATAVRQDGGTPARPPHRAHARPRHHFRRHRARLDPGTRRRPAHRAPRGPPVHGRLHEGGDRLLVRHRPHRPGPAWPGGAVQGGHRGRGTPAAAGVGRIPRGRHERGVRMSVDKEVAEYTAKTSRSRALHEEALAVMPGGNSRTTTFFDPYPFYIQRGQGAHVWDADGTDRIDFNGNYTSLILGHAHPDVVKAAQQAAEHGPPFPG